MSFDIGFILSLAGTVCANSSLAGGDALRKGVVPFADRVTPRMLLSLALLGCATVATLVTPRPAPEGFAFGTVLPFLLLAAGTAALVWAFASGPPYRGDETLAQRITPRGMLALGLLASAQVVELLNGPLAATLKQLQASANGSTSILAILGLGLLTVGTAAAAATLRSDNPLAADSGPLLQRLTPLARGTLSLLGLALGLVGLACLLSSGVAMLLCFVLLALGAATFLATLFIAADPGTEETPGPWGISSRGWVSLGLLALAGGVLGAQQTRLGGSLGGLLAVADNPGASANALRARSEPTGPVGDPPSIWSTPYATPAAVTDERPAERDRLARELAEARKQVEALSNRLANLEPASQPSRTPQPATSNPTSKVVDLTNWHHPPAR